MAEQTGRPSLKDFEAYADRNGQDSPLDVGLPANTQADLKRDPAGDAQAARIALKGEAGLGATMEEAIDRATASVGQDDGKR